MTDEKLIELYLNGDTNAMDSLVELYKDRIHYSVYNMGQDKYAAEDVFREVFICIINNMIAGKTAEERNFLQWATRIAQNLCIEYNRKNKRAILLKTSAEEVPIFSVSNPMPNTNFMKVMIKLKA